MLNSDVLIDFSVLLSRLPLVDCKTKTTKQNCAKNTKHSNPDPSVALIIRSRGWGWNERVSSSRESFTADVSVVKSVQTSVDLGGLGNGISIVIVSENTKHFLEEHTTKDNVAGLSIIRTQVGNFNVTLSCTARSLHICCKSCKRNAHVVS